MSDELDRVKLENTADNIGWAQVLEGSSPSCRTREKREKINLKFEHGEILQGDCLELMKELPEDYIDLIVTSPPYDNLRTYGGFSWCQTIWQGIIKELYRITKPGGVVVWIVNDATVNGSETGTSFKQALWAIECGFNLHDTMIWDKNVFTAVGSLVSRYAPVFEYMFVWVKGKIKTFNPIKDKINITSGDIFHGTIRQKDGTSRKQSGAGVKKISDMGQRHNIWEIPPEMDNSKRSHPAMFPEKLAQDHIISWSNESDLVFDPFMGSGTTAISAIKLKRRYLGCELNPEYMDIISKRIRKAEDENRLWYLMEH